MLNKLYFSFMGVLKNRKGQGMVEYALIIALVAILLIGALTLFKDKIANVFTTITNAL